jgi:hypothetical protein
MTKAQATTTEGEATSPEATEGAVAVMPEVDWFLQRLVDLTNDHFALDFPVTLHVKGLTITGVLVSGRTYFERWANELSGSLNFENGEDPEIEKARQTIRENFSRFGEIYPTAEEAALAADEFEADPEGYAKKVRRNPPMFIHLRDARFFIGDRPVPNNRPVLWRGRLSEVDGFMLGTLAAGEE